MNIQLKSERVYVDSVEEAIEICYQRGWTDGLPVVPPTEALVTQALQYLKRDPSESIGVIPPKNSPATVERIVINSIMGGCLPNYIPVVIAAVEAMLEKPFNLNGVQATTHCVCPLAIVSGPIVRQLGFNSEDGVFGGGSRANAAVGRAIRLIMWNIGGAHPGEIDRATLGHPGKYAYCIAENADGNPWEPIHVEKGLKPEDNAVTMFGCEAPHHLHTGSGTPEQTLDNIADAMSTIGNNNFLVGGEILVVMCPRAANSIAHAGWSRGEVKEYIHQNAVVTVARARKRAPHMDAATDAPHWTKFVEVADADAVVHVARRPEDINLVVAGGWGAAGSFCAVCPSWGYLGGLAQTKPIQMPS
ncbi:MAG: hypothetical protein ABIH46_03515 [Chloroflexota bacterium]